MKKLTAKGLAKLGDREGVLLMYVAGTGYFSAKLRIWTPSEGFRWTHGHRSLGPSCFMDGVSRADEMQAMLDYDRLHAPVTKITDYLGRVLWRAPAKKKRSKK